MNDEQKSKEQLLQEVQVLRQRVAVLEAAQAEHQQIEEALRSAKEYAETLQRYEGVGLGLFIVKTLVEAHSGWVAVESTPGKGACFRVFFPSG